MKIFNRIINKDIILIHCLKFVPNNIWQISEMKRFAQTVTGKTVVLYVWQGSEYASEVRYKTTIKVTF